MNNNTQAGDQIVYVPVSVKERLPITQTPVFCLQGQDAFTNMMCYVPKGNNGNKTPYWRDTDKNNITEPEYVTHWLEPRPLLSHQPGITWEDEIAALRAKSIDARNPANMREWYRAQLTYAEAMQQPYYVTNKQKEV